MLITCNGLSTCVGFIWVRFQVSFHFSRSFSRIKTSRVGAQFNLLWAALHTFWWETTDHRSHSECLLVLHDATNPALQRGSVFGMFVFPGLFFFQRTMQAFLNYHDKKKCPSKYHFPFFFSLFFVCAFCECLLIVIVRSTERSIPRINLPLTHPHPCSCIPSVCTVVCEYWWSSRFVSCGCMF